MSDTMLFTAILDYSGIQLVSQIIATSAQAIPPLLTGTIDWVTLGSHPRDCSLSFLPDDNVCAVADIVNVWCVSPNIGRQTVTIHLVATVRSERFVADMTPMAAAGAPPLFTVVIDYLGGTYISQLRRISAEHVMADIDAAVSWDALAPSPRSKSMTCRAGAPAPLSKLDNVWRFTGEVDEGLAVVHIIKTDELSGLST
jgi:hypothetical protein